MVALMGTALGRRIASGAARSHYPGPCAGRAKRDGPGRWSGLEFLYRR